jgi:hypothetical protein
MKSTYTRYIILGLWLVSLTATIATEHPHKGRKLVWVDAALASLNV